MDVNKFIRIYDDFVRELHDEQGYSWREAQSRADAVFLKE